MALNSKQELLTKAPNLQDSQGFTVSQLYQAVNNLGFISVKITTLRVMLEKTTNLMILCLVGSPISK